MRVPMRHRYCIELVLPSRPENAATIDVWVWADDERQARNKVEDRLQKLIGDGLTDPDPDPDERDR